MSLLAASTPVALKMRGLDHSQVDGIILSHLHGDHFGGLAWLLVDAQYVSKRTRPLIVTGPKGIAERFLTAAEALYPNITKCPCAVEFEFIEYEEQVPLMLWSAEYDPPAVQAGVAELFAKLCRSRGCPTYERLAGANHGSHVLSLGSTDTAAVGALFRFYHTQVN